MVESVRSRYLSPAHRRWLRLGITLLVLILCGVAATRLEWAGAAGALAQANLGWLTLSALLNFPFILLQSLRWRILLRPAGKVRLLTLFRYMLASRAASNLLPARAGEFLRIYLLRTRDRLPTVTVASTLFIERFFDAFILAVLVTPLLFLAEAPPWVRTGLLILIGGSFTGLAVVFVLARRGSRGGQSFFDRLAQSAEALRGPKATIWIVLLTAACWASELAMVLTCLAAVRLPAAPHVAILVLLAVNLGMILQVTPANLGPFEASALLALAALQITGPAALAFALLYHLVQIVPVTLAGFEGLRFVAEAQKGGPAEVAPEQDPPVEPAR